MTPSIASLARFGRPSRSSLRDAAVVFSLVAAAACTDSTSPALRQTLSARIAASTQPRIDSVLGDAVRRHRLPGMVAAVMRDGGIIAQGAAGIRHVGFPDEITVVDRFHLGSNVKAMTSTMIATLVDDGKLNWTSTPASVFPELASSMNPQLANATLERILQHRAGLPGFEDEADYLALPPFSGTIIEQRRAFATYVLQRPPAVPPGEWQYSNAGYIIAGAMAERVTGQSWEDLMQARVFGPLGMSVSYDWPAVNGAAQPWGHFPAGDAYFPFDPSDGLPKLMGPAGNISMSLQEYAKFIRLHLRALRGHPQLVSAAGFAKLYAPNGNYALGWVVGEINGAPFIGHEGSSGVFHALLLIFPTRNIAVAVFVNAAGPDVPLAAEEVGFALAQ